MHPKILESTIAQCRAYINAGDGHGPAPHVERLIEAVVQLAGNVTGSAAGHTTAEFSSLSTQAHGYGVAPVEAPSQHTDPSKWPSKADIDRAHGVTASVECNRCGYTRLLPLDACSDLPPCRASHPHSTEVNPAECGGTSFDVTPAGVGGNDAK